MSAPCPGSNGVARWLARPSHATGLLSRGALQFYAIVLGLGLIGYGLWRGVMFLLWRII